MEDKTIAQSKSGHTKLLLTLAMIAGSVIVGGLFFNSQPASSPGRFVVTPSGPEEIYFTAARLPEKIDFAGERVPLENFDVRESLDREVLIVSNFHSQDLLYLKKTTRYFSVIEPILKQNNIPDDFKYLALAESGFLDKAISPSGAVGIWQFMKSAATENGLEVNEEVDERYHLEKATQAACRYFKNSYPRHGNWTMVAATYNAGISGMRRQIDIQDSKNYYDLLLNDETARYIFRILALKMVIGEPEKYGFKVSETEKYPVIPVSEVKVDGSINSFTDFARAHNINYKLLKQFNPWLRQPYLKNLKKKVYTIKIPQVGDYRKFVFKENNDSQ